MYPLAADQPYPRNQWWVAAYASELGRTLLARDILVVDRRAKGTPLAG